MSTYKQTIVGDNSSWADFSGWAGATTGVDSAFSTLGFTNVNDTYAANGSSTWANGSTNNGLSDQVLPLTSANLFPAVAGTFPATTSNARIALSGTNFMGAYNSGTTYAQGNVVYYTPSSGAQQTYICINAAGSTGNAPTNTTYFAPYWFSIWAMEAAGLDTVYIKLEYGCMATAADPAMSIQFGSQYVSDSGVLSGNVSTVEQCFIGTAEATSSECDFAGDGENWFAMFMHRANTSHSSCVAFERAISGQSSGPVYSNGSGTAQYLTYLVGFTGPVWHQCSLFLASGVGTTSSVRNPWGSPVNIFTAGSQIVNNITPALPIFPLVGWVGNPLSAIQAYSVTDSNEGIVISSNVYGSATSYLTSINAFLEKLGGTASIFGVGIKWM